MFLQYQDLLLELRQFEIRRRIEPARFARLARQPRRRSIRRNLGRQLIRIGARLAADPALRPARIR